jgi:hypothetical protein
MKPNTPHAVVTLNDAIVAGGHFNASSTMLDTALGTVHTLMCQNITNAHHDLSRQLVSDILAFYHDGYVLKRFVRGKYSPKQLRAILKQYIYIAPEMSDHLPDLETTKGLFNVLATCNLAILSNVLDRRTYREREEDGDCADIPFTRGYILFDRNAINEPERRRMATSRGRALDLMRWIAHNHEATDGVDGARVNIYGELILYYLARQGRAIVRYKKLAENLQVQGFEGCKYRFMKIQMANAMQIDPKLSDIYDQLRNMVYDSLDWAEKSKFVIKRRKQVDAKWKVVDFESIGTTLFDNRFYNGRLTNFTPQIRQTFTLASEDESSGKESNMDTEEDSDDENSSSGRDTNEAMDVDNSGQDSDVEDQINPKRSRSHDESDSDGHRRKRKR